MKQEYYMQAIDALLSSEGDYKLIYILGGEPLLKKVLIKSIVNYAHSKNITTCKKLHIILSTSWIISIDSAFFTFLKNNSVKISFSLDWIQTSHDAHRTFKDWSWSFNRVLKNLKKLEWYSQEDLYGVITVSPDKKVLDNLFKSYLFLSDKLLFKWIHISIVKWVEWQEKEQIQYIKTIKKILDLIYLRYSRGQFFFLTSFSRYITRNYTNTLYKRCLYNMIEVHANGDVGHSLWSHFFYDDAKFIDFHITQIWLEHKKCENNSMCSCTQHKEYVVWVNKVELTLGKIFEKYEKLFWEDYKKYILQYNKFI